MRFDAINQFQSTLYALLASDPELVSEIGDAIYDATPLNWPQNNIYVQIGDGQMRNRSAQKFEGRDWVFEISTLAKSEAFGRLVPLSNHIQKLILEYDFAVPNLRRVQFMRAQTYRLDQEAIKRLALQFKASFQLLEEV